MGFSKLKLAFRYPGLAWDRVRALRAKKRITPLLKGGETQAFPPAVVSLNLTHRCNLKCRMCGQWRRKDTLKRDMLPLSRLKEIVDEVAPFRPKIFIWGGEPLLYPEIVALLKHVKLKKLTVILNTNGVLLDKFAEALVESGVDGLDVSLDGPAEVHDRIRGMAGTFARVISGLKQVRQGREKKRQVKPMLKGICVITESSQEHLPRFIQILEEEGWLDALIINLGWFTKQEIGEANRRVFKERLGCVSSSWEDFVDALGKVDPGKVEMLMKMVSSRPGTSCLPIFFRPALTPAQMGEYYSRPEHFLSFRQCGSPWINLDIRPNGDVTFCPDYPDYLIGNVKEQALLKIWNGEKAQNFRRALLQHGLFPICSRCCGLFDYGF